MRVEQCAFGSGQVHHSCLRLVEHLIELSLYVVLAANCLLSHVLTGRNTIFVGLQGCIALPSGLVALVAVFEIKEWCSIHLVVSSRLPSGLIGRLNIDGYVLKT